MVYFVDLDWRSAGTLGHDSLYLSENDTGPDDSVHSMEGVFIYRSPNGGKTGEAGVLHIEDIAPTILNLFDVPIPKDMEGHPIGLK
jgi:predicted AlkP superfamily phosphohydrolase/phosphomutase